VLSVGTAIIGYRSENFFNYNFNKLYPSTTNQILLRETSIHFSILFRDATGRSTCIKRKYLKQKAETKTKC